MQLVFDVKCDALHFRTTSLSISITLFVKIEHSFYDLQIIISILCCKLHVIMKSVIHKQAVPSSATVVEAIHMQSVVV